MVSVQNIMFHSVMQLNVISRNCRSPVNISIVQVSDL